MAALPLGQGEQQRSYGHLPRLRLRNMFLENDPTNTVDGLARMQRPGLAPFVNLGSSPIDAVWQVRGTFNGDHLILSGGAVNRVASDGSVTGVGTIASGRAQIASSDVRAIIVAGNTAYSTDGTSTVPVNMPAGFEAVSGVAFVSGFFVLTILGTQRYYWIEPGQTDPDPLSFAEAERSPDPIVSPAVASDLLWLLGSASEEVWALTGDINAPFQRVNGRVYESGCLARDSLVEVDSQLIWVTADYRVALAAGIPQMVDTPAISEHLRLSDPTTLRAWYFKFDSHTFYVLTSNLETLALDLSTKAWLRFSSLDSERWRAHLGAGGLCGDATSGRVWSIDPTRNDDDGDIMLREISGGVEITGAPVPCNSLNLRLSAGWTRRFDYEPLLEFCWSDDEGNLWTDWRQIGLGKQGQYDAPVVIRKLGLMRRPGRIFWFRCTDDIALRISYARINEAWD